jgi:hypothetical protein
VRNHRLLALWSAPRSRSTAFFRMMLERGDFTVVHEPFSSRAEHGHVEIDGVRVSREDGVIRALRDLSRTRPVFFKDTTDAPYPAVLADAAFLRDDVCHTFIIRHPAETIPSYYAINPQVKADQIGIERLHEIFTAVRELTGRIPVVLDSADLVRSPEAAVEAYCRVVRIPHRPGALSWTAGDRPEWRATEWWHRDVRDTTGFADRPAAHGVSWEEIPHLVGYLTHHLPFYELLHGHRIGPSAAGE